MLLVVGGWLLALAAAALLGSLAVYLLGSGVAAGTGPVRSAEDVARELDRTAAPDLSVAPSQSPGSRPPAPAPGDSGPGEGPQVVQTEGGSVTVRCRESRAELVSWTPRQGFGTDDEVRGPGDAVYLEFSSADVKVHITIGCSGNTLTPLVATGDDD